MKICSLGTTRLDFHIYKPEVDLQENKEIKLDNLEIKVGGSVYNTTTLLKYFNIDLSYYTVLGNDEISVISKSALKNHGINYFCTSSIESKGPVTFIHLDRSGEKVMFSYDGTSFSKDIIDLLSHNMYEYDAFFTSCYEINDQNYVKLSDIFSYFYQNNRNVFLDLSPLLHIVSKNIWERILSYVTVLTGTEHEFKSLCDLVGLHSAKDLIDKFNITKLYIKKGSEGCTVISDHKEKKFLINPIKSKNLTGCGDAFNAGVIFGEMHCYSIKNTVKLATDVAAHVARLGFDPKIISGQINFDLYSR